MIGDPRSTARWQRLRTVILDRDGSQCTSCGSTTDLQVDHVIPLASIRDAEERNRLAFDPDNLATLCRRCNRAKSDKPAAPRRSTWLNPRWFSKEDAAEFMTPGEPSRRR